MSQSPTPKVESAQPSTPAANVRGNQSLFIILAAGAVVAVGLSLFVVLTRPQIKTSAGNLSITKVQFSDSFPPGCTSSSPEGCSMADAGYRILIIWMKSQGGSSSEMLARATPNQVYVVSEDGARTQLFSCSVNFSPSFITLAFPVKESERNFRVVWPGNPDVNLSPILYLIP
jgi:hypothetical protein